MAAVPDDVAAYIATNRLPDETPAETMARKAEELQAKAEAANPEVAAALGGISVLFRQMAELEGMKRGGTPAVSREANDGESG